MNDGHTVNDARRRRIMLSIALAFVVVGVLWGSYWVLVLAKRERTDDAYVNGNKVVISAQVSGTVVAVLHSLGLRLNVLLM